jgi:hypothetical protein
MMSPMRFFLAVLLLCGCEEKNAPPLDMSAPQKDMSAECLFEAQNASCQLACEHAVAVCGDDACSGSLVCDALRSSEDCSASCNAALQSDGGIAGTLIQIGCLQNDKTCMGYLSCLQICTPLPQG